MKHSHFNPFTLSTYLTAEGPSSEFIWTLLVCQECRRSLETLSEWLQALDHFNPLVGPKYVTRYDLFFRLLRENDSHEERLEAIEHDELYNHWGFTQLLIEESKDKRACHPDFSKQLAELAVTNSELLDPAFYHPKWIGDLSAVAAVTLAEAHLALGDTEHARQLLRKASNWQLGGTLRPRIARLVARLRARILWELGRQDEEVNRLLQGLELSDAEDLSNEGNLYSWFLDRWRDRDHEGTAPTPGVTSIEHGE